MTLSLFMSFAMFKAQQVNVTCEGGTTACFWFDFDRVPPHVTGQELSDYIMFASQTACENNLNCGSNQID